MHKESYDRLSADKLIRDMFDPTKESLTGRGKKAWSQVQQQMHDLDSLDLSKADRNCDHCNGTGILRHAKIGGVLTTIVCSCLADKT